MAKEKQTALAAKEEGSLVLPAGEEGKSAYGDVDMGSIIPRLKLLQALSKPVQDGVGRPGDLMNSLTDEVYDQPLQVVPLKFSKGAIYFETGEGLKCKSEDGIHNTNGDRCDACPYNVNYKEWKDGQPPLCSETFEWVVVEKNSLSTGIPDVFIVTFMKTSKKVGESLFKKSVVLDKTGKAPMYVQVFELESFNDKKEKGQFQNFKARLAGKTSQEELELTYKLYKKFENSSIKAHEVDSMGVDEVSTDDQSVEL